MYINVNQLISQNITALFHVISHRNVRSDQVVPMQQQLGCLFRKVKFPNAKVMMFIMFDSCEKHVQK